MAETEPLCYMKVRSSIICRSYYTSLTQISKDIAPSKRYLVISSSMLAKEKKDSLREQNTISPKAFINFQMQEMDDVHELHDNLVEEWLV